MSDAVDKLARKMFDKAQWGWLNEGENKQQFASDSLLPFAEALVAAEEALAKVQSVCDSKEFVGVFMASQLHGMPYRAQTFGSEVRAALAQLRAVMGVE